MAAHGGLILEKIEPFNAILFPDYDPSGYGKQGNGGFHTQGSLTYVFRKSQPPRPGLPLMANHFHSQSILDLLSPQHIHTPFGTVVCSSFHSRAYQDNPLKMEPIVHLLQYLMKRVSPQSIVNADDKAPLHIPCTILQKSKYPVNNVEIIFDKKIKKPAKCSIDGRTALLRDSLIYSIPHLSHSCKFTLVQGHIFRDFGPDFSIPPVGTEAMLWGDGATTAVLNILTQLAGRGHCLLRIPNEGTSAGQSFFTHVCYEIVFVDKMLVLGHVFHRMFDTEEVCTVDLDAVALMAYSANDWRELRSEGCHVSLYSNEMDSSLNIYPEKEINNTKECEIHPSCMKLKLIPESLYPPTFIFDVCISLNNAFYEGEFWKILWYIVGDIVTKVELLNSYNPPPEKVVLGHKPSKCYRLNYCSYKWPLHRQSTVKIQNEVVNWAIVNVLGLCIK